MNPLLNAGYSILLKKGCIKSPIPINEFRFTYEHTTCDKERMKPARLARRPDLWKCKTRSETIRNPVMFEENQKWFLTVALFPYWDLRWFKMDIIKVVVIFIWKPMVKRGSPTLRHTPMGMGQKLLDPQMWLEMGWWSPLNFLGVWNMIVLHKRVPFNNVGFMTFVRRQPTVIQAMSNSSNTIS